METLMKVCWPVNLDKGSNKVVPCCANGHTIGMETNSACGWPKVNSFYKLHMFVLVLMFPSSWLNSNILVVRLYLLMTCLLHDIWCSHRIIPWKCVLNSNGTHTLNKVLNTLFCIIPYLLSGNWQKDVEFMCVLLHHKVSHLFQKNDRWVSSMYMFHW